MGYEALGLWSEYLFATMPRLPRLDLRTWSGNHGMMRLAEKLGYRLEARFRKARMVHGHYYDGMGYGILVRSGLPALPMDLPLPFRRAERSASSRSGQMLISRWCVTSPRSRGTGEHRAERRGLFLRIVLLAAMHTC